MGGWDTYISPIIHDFTDANKLIPENERISIQDVASEGEWEVSNFSKNSMVKEYPSKHGVYKMTVSSYDDEKGYFHYTYLDKKIINEEFGGSRARTFKKSIENAY